MELSGIQVNRPIQVTRAVTLLWLSLVIGFVASLPIFLELMPADTPIGEWFPVATIWAIILVLTFGSGAGLTWLVSKRHNWARIVMFIFFISGVTILLWAPGSTYHASLLDRVFQGVCIVLDLIAFYWLFTGSGNAWFTKHHE